MLPEVLRTLVDLGRRAYFNPHATNRFSEEWRRACLRAAQRLLELLGIPEDEADVIWTSGGTEANNLACLGCLRGTRPRTWAVESTAHASVLGPCREHARAADGHCRELPVAADGGVVPTFPDPPGLVALLHVNNETGVVQDLPDVRERLRRTAPRARLFVDAAQSFAKLDIPWRQAGIDLLAVSGRKIGGPPAVGALIRRKSVPLVPLFYGGGQQAGLRPGTLDAVGILGFITAAETAFAHRTEFMDRVRDLNDRLRLGLLARFGSRRLRILSPPGGAPHILSFALPGVEGAVVMRALSEQGIVVGTGSACSAESAEPSHVLTAMGVPARTARGALRVSFGRESSPADVDALLEALPRVLARYGLEPGPRRQS